MVYPDSIEDKIDLLMERITSTYPDFTNKRWLAIKYLEKDSSVKDSWPMDVSDILDHSYEKKLSIKNTILLRRLSLKRW